MIVACAALVLGPAALLETAESAWRRTPEMRIEDAYKWLYQATRGGEHAVVGEAGPRAWLLREWATLSAPGRSEPEVEVLGGQVARVNLRPYRARGGDPEMLLAVFVASAERFERSPAGFATAWRALGERLERRGIGKIRHSDWRQLDDQARVGGYPAIHHSEPYRRAYAPAYRVVLRAMW